MQILNPDASNNTDPVTGIDGRAATAAMDRYGTQVPRAAVRRQRLHDRRGRLGGLSNMGR